mmetsp:Transcript_17416/g.16614  ORF Transcript_17416/g.16614 Transcript_17416/m.16614 type:complete len:80 (+) Transcript_17416:290-529(+)
MTITPFFDKIIMNLLERPKGSFEDNEAQILDWINSFKFGMIIVIYMFSTYIKSFRESCNNFEGEEDLQNMIDRMISKIQ